MGCIDKASHLDICGAKLLAAHWVSLKQAPSLRFNSTKDALLSGMKENRKKRSMRLDSIQAVGKNYLNGFFSLGHKVVGWYL